GALDLPGRPPREEAGQAPGGADARARLHGRGGKHPARGRTDNLPRDQCAHAVPGDGARGGRRGADRVHGRRRGAGERVLAELRPRVEPVEDEGAGEVVTPGTDPGPLKKISSQPAAYFLSESGSVAGVTTSS